MNKILIIDDDRELCALIKRSVQSEHIEADFCNTGKEGLQKLKEQEYQLVVLDVMMPGMDGFETLYLSAILDLYDRSVVSHVISRRNDNKLVFQTFDKAIASNPDAKPIFHSDRGFQYTGRVFQTKLTNQEMEQSMSRVGRCIDNGPTEGFWGIIKSEMYYLQTFKDEKSLRSAIEKYIHFYNYERFQERFETRTPMEVRTEALNSDTPALYPVVSRVFRKLVCSFWDE